MELADQYRAWAEELVDLTAKNDLINFKPTKTTTIYPLDEAVDRLLKGESFQEGISRRQSQRIVAKGYGLLVEDLKEMDIDRKEMVSQLIVNLQAGIQKSLSLGHISAMVACVRTLNDLCGLGVNNKNFT